MGSAAKRKCSPGLIFWRPIGCASSLLEISLRKECGFTQREAAVLNNVSLPFLNPLEQGKETALHVSKRFGIALTLALPTYQNQLEVVSP